MNRMQSVCRPPIYKTALAWILLLPMLFFLTGGTMSLDRLNSGADPAQWNYATDTRAGSSYFQAEQLLIYAIVLVIMAFSLKSTLNLALRHSLAFSLPLFALVSVLWSQSLAKTIPFAVFGLILTMFGVYLADQFDPDRLIELLLFVGWAAILISLAAVAFYPAAGIWRETSAGAWRGIYLHKNHLGMMTTFMLIPAFFAKPKSRQERFGLLAYFLLSVLLIAFSQSRTAWILFVITMAAIGFLRIYPRLANGERLLLIVFTALVVPSITVLVVVFFREIAIGLGKDPTLTGRTLIWSAVWKAIGNKPILGYGYKAFWLGLHSVSFNIGASIGSTNLGNSENGIFEIWLELGVVGVALLMATMLQAVRRCLRIFGRKSIPLAAGWYIMVIFTNLLTFVTGGKFMSPHSLAWALFITTYVGLAREAGPAQTLAETAPVAALRAQEVG